MVYILGGTAGKIKTMKQKKMTVCYYTFLETVKQRIMLRKMSPTFCMFQKCLEIQKGFMYITLFDIAYLLAPYYNIQG